MNTPLFALMAEFKEPEKILIAARITREKGYKKVEVYSPFPINGLPEVLGYNSNVIGWTTFVGGIVGVISGYALQYYSSVLSYPHNIGGRPLNSWPAFIPICFELGILFAAFSAIFSMFILNGLPQPYHPIFNAPDFSLATRDRFFLTIEENDPLFDVEVTKAFLNNLEAEKVIEVYR